MIDLQEARMYIPSRTTIHNHFAHLDVNIWAVLDNLPEYIAVINEQGSILYLNATWYQLLLERSVGSVGFNVGSNFIASFAAAFGSTGADVQSMEKGLLDVLQGKREQFVLEYPYFSAGHARQRWFTTTITPMYNAHGSRGALIQQVDSTRCREEQDRLHTQQALLKALDFASQQLLNPKAENLDQSIQRVLDTVGGRTGMQRICLFENDESRETLLLRRRWEWNRADEPVPHRQRFPSSYEAMGLAHWPASLRQGQVVYGECLPSLGRDTSTEKQGTAIVPIFVGGQWWGFVGFAHPQWKTARPKPGEIGALRTLASVIGAALLQQHGSMAPGAHVAPDMSLLVNT